MQIFLKENTKLQDLVRYGFIIEGTYAHNDENDDNEDSLFVFDDGGCFELEWNYPRQEDIATNDLALRLVADGLAYIKA